MTDFTVNTGKANRNVWSESKLEKKLLGMVNAQKKVTWIQSNLSTSKSGFFGRLFWCVAKHFNWMRRLFYSVDLEKSKALLQQLQPQVYNQKSQHLIKLFKQAVANFNQIAPKHMVSLPADPSGPTKPNPFEPLPPQQKPELVKAPSVPIKFDQEWINQAPAELVECYYGNISEDEVKLRLAGKPPKAYLIADDKMNPSNKILWIADKGGTQFYNIIQHWDGSYKIYNLGFSGIPDLKKLLEDLTKNYYVPLKGLGSASKTVATIIPTPVKKTNVPVPVTTPSKPTVDSYSIPSSAFTSTAPSYTRASLYAQAYHGKISPGAAQSLLTGKPIGSFLIRDSEVDAGTRIFNYVGSSGDMEEFRLKKVIGGYELKTWIGTAPVFPSLEKFVEAKAAQLVIPLAPATPLKSSIASAPVSTPTATPNSIPSWISTGPTTSVEFPSADEKFNLALYHKMMYSNAEAQAVLGPEPIGTYLISKLADGSYKYYYKNAMGAVTISQSMTEDQVKMMVHSQPDICKIPFPKEKNKLNLSSSMAKVVTSQDFANLADLAKMPLSEKVKMASFPNVIDMEEAKKILADKPNGFFFFSPKDFTSTHVYYKSLAGVVTLSVVNTANLSTSPENALTSYAPKQYVLDQLKYPLSAKDYLPSTASSESSFPPPTPSGSFSSTLSVPAPLNKLAEGQKAKEALDKGEKADDLLVDAFKNNQLEVAAWLLRHGANIGALDAITDKTPTQLEICEWLNKLVKATEITPKNMDDFALGLGLGYKSANLMVLQSQADKMSKKLNSSSVKVPPFLPIGDFEMQQYLMKAVPQVQKRWEEFLDTFDATLKAEFLKTENDASKIPLKISPEGLKIIEDIEKMVTAHFTKNPYFTFQMQTWLEREDPDFIIVRSTGKEDSDTNSNAGGNASIPFIKPDAHEISKAMGEVIASYFGEKSVGQRLMAGDRSLFTEKKPFIPVLLQVMIGENVGGVGSKNDDIPRSGVLFTRQQDKAEGVTLIQTGLGNNEGIVSSRVLVDSYYVGSDKNIHAVVRKKTTRFVSIEDKSSGTYKCEAIKNRNTVVENTQALPDNVILDLKQVADDVAENYAAEKGGFKPMDMEYTIKLNDEDSKPVIYLLQARPLLSSKQGTAVPEKSFLNLKSVNSVAKKDKMNVETLLDGNAYVRQIEKSDDVLFADNITAALKAYTDMDGEKIKAIVIKKTAPATSHEAVVLRPKGVAVFVVSDPAQFDRVKKMADKATPQNPVYIDPQRSILVDTQGVADAKSFVKKGMISYPIPLEASIPRKGIMFTPYSELQKGKVAYDFSIKIAHLNSDFKQLIETLKGGQELLKLDSKANPNGYSIRGLLDEMAVAEDPAQAKLALATLLNILHKRLINNVNKAEAWRADVNQMMLSVFEAVVKMAKEEVAPALEKHKAQSLERLFSIKFLDAFIFQGADENVVGQFSYARALNTDNVEKKEIAKAKAEGISYSGVNGFKQLQMQKFSSNAFSQECQKNWNDFTKEIMDAAKANPKNLDECIKLIEQITAMKLSPIWLNVVFNREWKDRASEPARALKVLGALKAVQQINQTTMKWLSDRTVDLNILASNIEKWSKDSDFPKKNIGKLRDQFIKTLGFDKKMGPGSLKVQYDTADEFGRLALMQYMRRAVNIYDETIKAVKGSSAYTDQKQQIKDFAELLQGYFEMMEASFKLIAKHDENQMMQPSMGSPVKFDDYINYLHNGKDYYFGFNDKHTSIGFNTLLAQARNGTLPNLSQQIEARPEFSVDSFIIGSKADLNFSSHWPTRFEEYFTAFHQNMEKVAKFLNTKNGMNAGLLSKEVNEVCTDIKANFKEDIASLNAEGSKIEITYQVPLRQHSGSLCVKYDAKAPEKGMDLEVQMFGNDEHDRWDQSATFGALLAHIGGVAFTNGSPAKINYAAQDGKREGVAFSLHVPSNYKDKQKLIQTLFYICKKMTMGSINYVNGLQTEMTNKMGAFDWKDVKEEFFADSFYLNDSLLTQYSAANNTDMVIRIAKNTLLGMARQDVKDYTLRVANGGLSGYLNDVKFNYVPGNTGYGIKGLKTGATLHLLKALDADPAQAGTALHELINDPDMKKKMPDIVQALKFAVASLKSPQELFKEFMALHKYAEAYALARKLKDQKLIEQVELVIEALAAGDMKNEMIALAKEFYMQGMSNEADTMIIAKIKNMLAEEKAEFEQFKLVKSRDICLAQLGNNVATLQSMTHEFDKNYKAILELSAKCLIGLSQNSDFNNQSYPPGFTGLSNYLGKDKYKYVLDNQYPDTTKLRKAAPLYIIQGFESANPDIRKSAFNAMEKLATDFLLAGKASMHVADLEKALFAIARGYFESMNDKTQAINNLVKVWKKDAVTLQKIVATFANPAAVTMLNKALV